MRHGSLCVRSSREITTKEPGLDDRHRDKNGEISPKHGNTEVKTLRKIYGPGFGPGFAENAKLSSVLETLHQKSLSQVLKLHADHESGALEREIKRHS